MDSIFELVYFLLHWRFSLSVVTSIAAAMMLSNVFVGFTAGYCISLVLCGTAFGALWQGRGEAGIGLTDPVPETQISHWVAFMGFAIIGFFWGHVAAFVLNSNTLGGVALVLVAAAVGAWYRWGKRVEVSVGYMVFATGSLLFGFSVPWLLQLAA